MDMNVRAFRTVQAAVSELTVLDERKESSRKGGLRGGPSRARKTSPERRKEIAMKANAARWKKETHSDSSSTKVAKS